MYEEIRTKWAEGKIKRIVSARILPGSDFISGVEKICIENGIKAGALSGMGSLEKATFLIPAKQDGTKKGVGYSELKTVMGPLEILSAEGFISKDSESDKGLFIHLHGVLCDEEGRLFGGHFSPGQNPTLLTLDVVIFEYEDISLSREYDPEIEMRVITPRSER
jgi:predicted DNA-binding protein with PD1-like motif